MEGVGLVGVCGGEGGRDLLWFEWRLPWGFGRRKRRWWWTTCWICGGGGGARSREGRVAWSSWARSGAVVSLVARCATPKKCSVQGEGQVGAAEDRSSISNLCSGSSNADVRISSFLKISQ